MLDSVTSSSKAGFATAHVCFALILSLLSIFVTNVLDLFAKCCWMSSKVIPSVSGIIVYNTTHPVKHTKAYTKNVPDKFM